MKLSIYVYAIGRADQSELPLLDGILGRPVFRITADGLAAVVSECPLAALRPERHHIAASQRVLNGLGGRQLDLLPMAFGTIAKSQDALRGFFADHRESLSGLLDRVAGKIEMDLRLNLDVHDPIAFLVEATPALKAARDRAFARRGGPSYDTRIRLGQQCDEVLRRYRETQSAAVTAALVPVCAEIAALPVSAEREIARFAMLVPRDGVEPFESAIEAVAAQLPDALTVVLGGPFPPHNFVQLEL